jgi:PAS domain S-box-containing protein
LPVSNRNTDSLYLALDQSSEIKKIDVLNSIAQNLVQESPRKAINLSQESYQLAIKYDDQKGKQQACTNLGNAYSWLGYYNQALEHYRQALFYSDKLDDPQRKALALINISGSYKNLGRYDLAVNYLFQARKIAEQLNTPNLHIQLILNFGQIYELIGDYQRSLDYYTQALQTLKNSGDQLGVAEVYRNLGNVYNDMNIIEKARNYQEMALGIFQNLNDIPGTCITLIELGKLYNTLGDVDQALANYIQALNDAEKLQNNDLASRALTGIGQVYAEHDRDKEAREAFMKSLTYAVNGNNKSLIEKNYFELSKLWEKNGDFNKSLNFYKKYTAVKDSMLNKEVKDKILTSELEEKEIENQLLRKDNEIQRLRIDRQHSKKTSYFLILFFILLILIILIILVRQKSQLNKKLQHLNNSLESTVRERTRELQQEINDRTRSENELRKSEERYFIAQQAAQIGNWEISLDNDEIILSNNIENLFEIPEGSFSGSFEDIFRLVHPDDVKLLKDAIEEARNGKKIIALEHRLIVPGKRIKWIAEYARAITNSEGRPYRLTGIVQDITARKHFEEKLITSEKKYREIIDSLPITYAESDSSMNLIFLNKAGQTLTGYNDKDISNGFPLDKLITDHKQLGENFRRALRRERNELTRYQLKHKDGRQIDVLIKSIPLENEGKIIGIRSAVIDISENIKINLALKESEEKFRELSAMLPETIYEFSTDGILTFINHNGLKMFGYDYRDFERGISIFNIISREQSDILRNTINNLLKGIKVGGQEYVAIKKDGTHFPVILYANPIQKNGEIKGIRGIATDITSRKEMENKLKEAQKLQALGTLAGGIAHDFNNILMGMQLFTELAIKKIPENHTSLQDLQKVSASQSRAKELIRQILAFSRQSGDEREPILIHEALGEAMSMIRSTLPATIKVIEDLPPCGYILGNKAQMHQILMNLCTNALHAMHGNGILNIKLEPAASTIQENNKKGKTGSGKANKMVKIAVIDNGAGMDEKTSQRIFEPFFTTKKIGTGTGLGLATVYGIVKQYGGEINFNTAEGKGTAFYIYLPALTTK